MLPTLTSMMMPGVPNLAGNGQFPDASVGEVIEISFASLLPVSFAILSDPAITGNPASPTGKILPITTASDPFRPTNNGAVGIGSLSEAQTSKTLEVEMEPDLSVFSTPPEPWLATGAGSISRSFGDGIRISDSGHAADSPKIARSLVDDAKQAQLTPQGTTPASNSGIDVKSLSAAIEQILPGQPQDGRGKPVEVQTQFSVGSQILRPANNEAMGIDSLPEAQTSKTLEAEIAPDLSVFSTPPKPWLATGAGSISRSFGDGIRISHSAHAADSPKIARSLVDDAKQAQLTPQGTKPAPDSGVDVKSLSAAIEQILPGKPQDGRGKPVEVQPKFSAEILAGKENAVKESAPISPTRSVPTVETNSATLPRLSAKLLEKDKESPASTARPIALVAKSDWSTKSVGVAEVKEAIAAPVQQPVPSFGPQVASLTSITPPQKLTASTEQPRDFGALIDRLAQARDASAPTNSTSVRAVMSHAEFGSVTVRFDQSGSNLAAHLSSQDPAFAHSARAALAADAAPRGDDNLRGQQTGSSQSGSNSPDGQSELQSGSHGRPSSQHREGKASAISPWLDADGLPKQRDQNNSNRTKTADRGIYI